jgi:hypothetical protein
MKNIWLKNKLLIIITGYALLFSVAIYFLVFLIIGKIKETSEQIQQNLVDQNMEELRLSNLPQMEKDWQDFQVQRNLTNVTLSPGNEINFIEGIDSIAQQSGNIIDLKIGDQVDPVEIAKIKKDTKKSKEQKGIMDEIGYDNYFPMQINLQGDYESLVNFIHMLENSHFYINVVSIESKKITINNNSDNNPNMFSSAESKKKESIEEVIISNINALVYTQEQ